MRLTLILFISFLFIGCRGCSKSAKRAENQRIETKKGRKQISSNRDKKSIEKHEDIGKILIKMEKTNGVYYIPVVINDIPMQFIFDTGAGLISISETEAIFLYKQGKLDENEILGTEKFMDANGDVSEGTIIILRTVKIGDKILYNIEASVVHNLGAPLLFGQSALEKFGKVTIDYSREEITFE